MNRLTQGQQLNINEELKSTNEKVRLVMQEDGNLVLYRTDNRYALWATGTWSKPVDHTVMQPDGNFVCYDIKEKPYWASQTAGHHGAELILQDDGNLVIYDPGSVPIWATNTVQGWNVKTITPQHADLGNGHHVVCTADLNVHTHQVKVSGQLTSTNKISGFHAGVAVLFYGADGKLLSRQERDFGVGQAPIIGAAHAPVNWDLQAPAGTAAFGLSQFWHPHWPLGAIGQAVGDFFNDVENFIAGSFDATVEWCNRNPDLCKGISFALLIVTGTALCLAFPASCEVVIAVVSSS